MEIFSFRCKLLLFFIAFLSVSFLTSDAATLSLSPSSTSTTVGSIFSVNVILDTQGTSTNGVDIHYLNFPASLLEVQDDGGALGVQIAPGTLMSLTPANSANNSTGQIDFSQVAYGSSFNGNGTLATIRFRALVVGTANISFNFIAGNTTDTNVDAGGVDILTSATGGAYTISSAPDTTPPVISAVATSSITQSSAVVSWTTNESATTRIDYGLTSSYGSQTAYDSTLATSHSQTISGLTADTLYHFRARSADAAGNLITSSDYTFRTSAVADTTSPARSSGSPSGQLAAGTTQATLSLTTDENATCRYSTTAGTAYSAMTAFSITGNLNHSHNVSGLTNGSSYNYYVRCQDTAGNANTTDFSISFSVASGGGGGGDTTPPTTPTNFATNVISASQINLSWTASTDANGVAGYRIYRCSGSACSPTVQIATSPNTSYSNTGLNSSTIYTYAVSAYDAAGNVSSNSATSSATTLSLDTTPPARSSGSPSGQLAAGTTQATLSLTTDENATCRYSITAGTAYSAMTNIISAILATNHSVNIPGLSDGNSYNYYVTCQNADGYANATDYQISFSIAMASSGGGDEGSTGGGGSSSGGGGGSIIVPPSGGSSGGGGGGTTVSNKICTSYMNCYSM